MDIVDLDVAETILFKSNKKELVGLILNHMSKKNIKKILTGKINVEV